jgi:coatomer protein complex subunit gamma
LCLHPHQQSNPVLIIQIACLLAQAVFLLWSIRKHDRLALSKLASQLIDMPLRTPAAQCMRLRVVGQVLVFEPENDRLLKFVSLTLGNPNDSVNLEAVTVLTSLPNLSNQSISQAVSALQALVNSEQLVTRVAAMRRLSKIAATHADAVRPLNWCIETRTTEPNRLLAGYAVTTLLRTAREGSIAPLMKSVSVLISDSDDEFKCVVGHVSTIREGLPFCGKVVELGNRLKLVS